MEIYISSIIPSHQNESVVDVIELAVEHVF